MFPDCVVITGLHLDCEGIQDCVRISRIALGLCKSVQSHSSSYYPFPISSARIVGGLHGDYRLHYNFRIVSFLLTC